MKTQQKIFMNRELSWLKFNERVLEEAENKEVPLCERLTFASIYQSNLDEFFMVRVGSLIDQILLDKNMKENKTKMTPKEQLDAIMPQVRKLNRRKDNVYEEMMDSLKEHNIHFVNFQKISKKESEYLRAYFQAEIAPLISPTIIGKRQPFPFLKNKEIYAVAVLETKNGKLVVKQINFRSTFYNDFNELYTKGYIDRKRPLTYDFNGVCVDTNIRYSEYLPIKDVMQHLYRLNEYYEVNLYKGTYYKETEKLDIGPLQRNEVPIRVFPLQKDNNGDNNWLSMVMLATKNNPNDIKVNIRDVFETIPDNVTEDDF